MHSTIYLILAGVCLVACGGDKGEIWVENGDGGLRAQGALSPPDSWEGTWALTLSFVDAQTQQLVAVETFEELLCPGEVLGEGLVPLLEDCRSEVEGDMLRTGCRRTISPPGCRVELSFDLEVLRQGDTMRGQGMWQTVLEGDCAQLGLVAPEEVEVEGQRLSTDIAACR